MKKGLKTWIAAMGVLLLWYTAAESGVWSAYLLPGPEQVAHALGDMFRDGELVRHALVSFRRVLTGFSVALVFSLLLAVITELLPALEGFYAGLLRALHHIPPMSLIPLLILWFGIGETSKIIFIVLTSFFPMYLNTLQGLTSCDRKLLEAGQLLGLSKAECFLRIRLPWAIPSILTGMQIGLGYSWRAIVGAEMIAAVSGLGYLILDAQMMARSDKVMAGILVIGLIGYGTDAVFSRLVRRFQYGSTGRRGKN